MVDMSSLMDIDDEQLNSKGKNVVVSSAPPDSKSVPWVEKYRPQSLDDVAAHRDIVDAIERLSSGNRLPHLLLYGPLGTGKTNYFGTCSEALREPIAKHGSGAE